MLRTIYLNKDKKRAQSDIKILFFNRKKIRYRLINMITYFLDVQVFHKTILL